MGIVTAEISGGILCEGCPGKCPVVEFVFRGLEVIFHGECPVGMFMENSLWWVFGSS